MHQLPMNVCQTCGSEGYSNLLIHCLQCEIVAVHRYCVDGPSTIDDDQVMWSCEECVPRILEPALVSRKSERICSRVDREGLRRKARRNWTIDLAPSDVEKSNCAAKGANKLADDAYNLDDKTNENIKMKKGKLKEKGTTLKKGGSEPAPLIRKQKKVLNSNDGTHNKSSKPSSLTGQRSKDLNSFYVDGEDLQIKQQKNLGPQLTEDLEHNPERISNSDEKSDRDSFADELRKYGQSVCENRSVLLEGEKEISKLQAAKQSDDVELRTSDNIEEIKAVSASDPSADKQPHFNIYEFQTSKKRRRLVIAMECSDSDEEPENVKPEPGAGDRSSEPVMKIGNHGLARRSPSESGHYISAQPSPIKSNDHFPTQPSQSDEHFPFRPSPTQSDDHFATRLSLIKLDNHMLHQTSSIGYDNRIIPQMSPVIVDYQVPAQPIVDAVWRGHCSISDDVLPMSFRLEAHLSNKAHDKVHGAASALPSTLSFELVPKPYAWPKSFQKSPPTGDTIGLYFFPVSERDEKWYESLIDEMIDHDRVMKSHINNLELLVFCSLILPREERRLQSKYYLWGVFKPRQETSLTSEPPGIYTSDTIHHYKNLGGTGTRSSASPSSVDNYSVTNSSNSDVHHKAGKRLVELMPSIILKNPMPSYNEQDYSSPLESSDIDGRTERNDNQPSRKFCTPQPRAQSTGDTKFSNHARDLKLYERTHEKPMKKWKDASFKESSYSSSSYRSAVC